MDLIWLRPFLIARLGAAAEALVRDKMTKAESRIASEMLRKGMKPPDASVSLCARDALFRLWKVVVSSGDIADWIRDSSWPKVAERALPRLESDATLPEIVQAVREAAIEQLF